MLNKIRTLRKKHWFIISVSFLLVVCLVLTAFLLCKPHKEGKLISEDIKDIKVTKAEMKEYRERIGTDMDVKKAYLILFEDEENCRKFIDSHGADENPTEAGEGIIPFMENGYYNIVGKQSLEESFDLLKDGEYSKEPVIYSNMFCYLKRIGIDSPVKDDKALKELIQNEKYQELKKAGD